MTKKIDLNENIFIAGSNGMVGSAIIRELKKQGYGNASKGGILLSPTRKELDLLNSNEVLDFFVRRKPSIVIIAAAKVGGIIANLDSPADFILENLKIQTNIIETSWKLGVKRLVFLGSSCIYPKYASQPIKEESLMSSSLEQTNEYYAIAKIAGIKLCESLRKQYNFDAISLMPTNLYGPGDNYHHKNSHVMASLIRKFNDAKKSNKQKVICWGTGNPKREFLHVDDLARAVVFALEKWDPSEMHAPKDSIGQELNYLNVGTGIDISIRKLASLISEIVGFKGEIAWDTSKPDGTPQKLLDVTRINKLGWFPDINLEDGIKQTISDINSIN